MMLEKKNLLLIASLTAILSLFNLFLLKNPFLGGIFFIFYLISLGFWLKISGITKQYWSSFLTPILMIMIINTGIYYIYGITRLTTALTLILLLSLFLLKQKDTIKIKLRPKIKISYSKFILYSSVLILDFILLGLIYINRTTDTLPSPWMNLDINFFLLYALTTTLLLITVYKTKSQIGRIVLTCLHLFLTYAIAPIIYPLGYGYDGFIHRVTENWIQNNGFILPKQPFYIGQYGFVVWLSNITAIPIFYIDVYLVPILASLTLPPAIFLSLKNNLKIKSRRAAQVFWLLPFTFFLSLHLTTPHNVVILLMILLIFSALDYYKNKETVWFFGLITITSLCTHPLLGMPIAIFALATFLLKNKKIPKTTLLCYLILITLIVPLLFTIHLFLSGNNLPTLTNPFTQFNKFLDLFRRPFWYQATNSIKWELLYIWQRSISSIIVILAIIGWFLKKNKKIFHYLFPLGFLGFMTGAWLMRSWIILPDLADFEQTNYPLRLITTSIIFLLPFSMYGLSKILSSTIHYLSFFKKNIQNIGKLILVMIASLALMTSLYFAYPQRNTKVHFPGFNVTQADFNSAELIHNQNKEYDYIVLANTINSVSALTKYSFAKHFPTEAGEIFYYSIPPGGPLYKLYQDMVYEGTKREYMEEAMAIAGVKKAYFVINDYWKNFDKIVTEAKKSADDWQIVDGGKIWIFEYQS